MAHYARVENGVVAEVIVIANAVLLDENGQEQESIGADFCHNTFGGEWVQTSYNANFRGKFANPGYFWDGKEFKPVPSDTGEVV
jgi:hypothetical protein